MGTVTRSVEMPDGVDPTDVVGVDNAVVKRLEQAFPSVEILTRGNVISIVSSSASSEPDALAVEGVVRRLIEAAARSQPFDRDSLDRLLPLRDGSADAVPDDARNAFPRGFHSDSPQSAYAKRAQPVANESHQSARIDLPRVIAYAHGVPIRPKTPGQADYVSAIDRNVITFGIGPAGTGKTYLAVAKAVQAFDAQQVRRIVLTRPAVEAGENLGYLPGTLNEKIDPYLRPLYDALSDMLGAARMQRFISDGTIEIAPLAYMRGRTLNDSFVILDEAQNTTAQQMKMFLTRLGFNTKMVVTGDATQSDLPFRRSGLRSIQSILGGLRGIAFVDLCASDVVRHRLVGQIVAAYEKYREGAESQEAQSNGR